MSNYVLTEHDDTVAVDSLTYMQFRATIGSIRTVKYFTEQYSRSIEYRGAVVLASITRSVSILIDSEAFESIVRKGKQVRNFSRSRDQKKIIVNSTE